MPPLARRGSHFGHDLTVLVAILLQQYLIWVRERFKLIVIVKKYTLNIYINGNVDGDNNDDFNDFNLNMKWDPSFSL